ncbi:hypothetical protein AwDysgo_20160 [Bacteroidales bacterium]|nr:hypothetical protein AwDysgo_20160 [Bacteroidales bacterium]
MKNKIKHLFSIYLCCIAFSTTLGQEISESIKREFEKEVKTSGLYLYGEGVANTKKEADKLAKSALLSEINKEILNHPEWQFAKKIEIKDVEYLTESIDLPRGNKIRALAYIKKNNIHATFSQNTPEVKLTDKKEEKTSTNKNTDKESNINDKATYAAEKEEESQSYLEDKEKQRLDSLNSTLENKTLEGATLLETIVKSKTIPEIRKIFDVNKMKITYGRMETIVDTNNAYIIVYKNSGEVVAILDTGATNERKDLISGEILTNDTHQDNLRIWFQIF